MANTPDFELSAQEGSEGVRRMEELHLTVRTAYPLRSLQTRLVIYIAMLVCALGYGFGFLDPGDRFWLRPVGLPLAVWLVWDIWKLKSDASSVYTEMSFTLNGLEIRDEKIAWSQVESIDSLSPDDSFLARGVALRVLLSDGSHFLTTKPNSIGCRRIERLRGESSRLTAEGAFAPPRSDQA